jgi:hypothetical protein
MVLRHSSASVAAPARRRRPRTDYAIAGWSPNGRTVLALQDVSVFHFTMWSLSVDGPATAVAIVEGVRVNHPRSWPGEGDVSWQPTAP